MVEFNADGSIKIPGQLAKVNEKNEQRLKSERCMRIKREVISFSAPKCCVLHLTISESFPDSRFVETIYNDFIRTAAVPSKIIKVNDRQFDIEIGTDFRRCTNCNSLVNRYKEFLDDNVIDEKGSCTFEGKKSSFYYEDHFE